MSERFNSALAYLGENLKRELSSLPITVKQNTEEIRLREGKPLAISVAGETVFVLKGGQTSFIDRTGLINATKGDVEESFRRLCNNSVFAHENELKDGFIRLKNGSRAGVFGCAAASGAITDVTSINIRIAREIKGSSTKIASAFRGEGWLIAGPPASGKTTMLRDFIRQISNGAYGKVYRVAVIDSRGEIGGFSANDLGLATDVLTGVSKAKGIEIAIRTMYPEVVAFDEIGSKEELNGIKDSFNAGVSVITTAHIGNERELLKRDITKQLLLSGAISRVAVLPKLIGGEMKVLTAGELLDVSN